MTEDLAARSAHSSNSSLESPRNLLGVSSTEVPITPGINWATNTYDKSGDMTGSNFGVVKIGIGSTSYALREKGGREPILIRHDGVDVPDTHTRVYLGYLGMTPRIAIVASVNKPFRLEDVQRINTAAILGSDLEQELEGIDTRDDEIDLINGFMTKMRAIGRHEKSGILDQIGVMRAQLEGEIKESPRVLRIITDSMEAAQIAGVNRSGSAGSAVASQGDEFQQYSPTQLRKMSAEHAAQNAVRFKKTAAR